MVAVLLVALVAAPAHASCAEETADAIAGSETVFVATATEQRHHHARVEVEEVWRGPDLAPTVWLQTTPEEAPWWPLSLVARSYSSVDARLVPGTRYLIATEEGGFRTNTCLVADAADPFVDRMAPEATRQPVASGRSGAAPSSLDGPAGTALAVALLTLLAAGIAITYRRNRTGAAVGRVFTSVRSRWRRPTAPARR